jgi:hypothetical protein
MTMLSSMAVCLTQGVGKPIYLVAKYLSTRI